MQKLVVSSFALVAVLVSAGCPSIKELCQKEYDCQDELGVPLEDDYVAVCETATQGQLQALRKNAEQECEDLAGAEEALATCLLTLDCEQFAEYRSNPTSDSCKEARENRMAKFEAAEFGAKCDGRGTGEGEGE